MITARTGNGRKHKLHRGPTDLTSSETEEGSSCSSCEPVDCADDELLRLAEERFGEEKLLEAYRLLRNVRDQTLLKSQHQSILSKAAHCEAAISDLIGEANDGSRGWTKQSEYGQRHTAIYYKIDTTTTRLDCRLETPIDAEFLIPLLSVMNESDLYATWVPSWQMPRIGVRSSRQIQKIGRVNQILQVIGDVPWPFSAREVLMKTQVVDEIDENGYFAVILRSLDPADAADDDDDGNPLPPSNPDIERIDFEGALLFRPCPRDHPIMARRSSGDRPMILVSFKM